jgi:hypothetical protein
LELVFGDVRTMARGRVRSRNLTDGARLAELTRRKKEEA